MFASLSEPLMTDMCGVVTELQNHPLVLSPLEGSLCALAETRFFERVLTSHLHTGGTTLLIGKSAEQVNPMLNILARFVDEEERHSSLATRTGQYVPDVVLQVMWLLKVGCGNVHLQGLVSSKDWIASKGSALLSTRKPSTVVDLARTQVMECTSSVQWCITVFFR